MNADKLNNLMERRGWRFDYWSESWEAVRFGFYLFVADYGAFVCNKEICLAARTENGLLDNLKFAEKSARELWWIRMSEKRKHKERIRSGK